jgi:hypothetical protein
LGLISCWRPRSPSEWRRHPKGVELSNLEHVVLMVKLEEKKERERENKREIECENKREIECENKRKRECVRMRERERESGKV